MKHDYSLAHLTVLSLSPPQVVDVAARAGYRYASLRMTRVTAAEPLDALAREAPRHFRESGVSALDRDGQSRRGDAGAACREPAQRRDADRHAAHGALELELRRSRSASARMVPLRTRLRRRATVSVDDRGDH